MQPLRMHGAAHLGADCRAIGTATRRGSRSWRRICSVGDHGLIALGFAHLAPRVRAELPTCASESSFPVRKADGGVFRGARRELPAAGLQPTLTSGRAAPGSLERALLSSTPRDDYGEQLHDPGFGEDVPNQLRARPASRLLRLGRSPTRGIRPSTVTLRLGERRRGRATVGNSASRASRRAVTVEPFGGSFAAWRRSLFDARASPDGPPKARAPALHTLAKPLTRRWRRVWVGAAGVAALLIMVRAAIHELPWFGPWLAEGLRAVFGAEAVTWLEEAWSTVEDDCNRLLRSHSPPRTLEQARPQSTEADRSAPPAAGSGAPRARRAPFLLPNVGAMDARVAGRSDGEWQTIAEPTRPGKPPVLLATLLHPDRQRPWSEVFVVAADIPRLLLYAVAGTREPAATTTEGRAYVRRGLIPDEHQAELVAAFNGGFMTKHGQHGMRVDGVTLVPPQPQLCTVLGLRDAVRVGSWRALGGEAERAERDGQLLFWRQAAPCMLQRGVLHPLLGDENVRNWGATIDGKVVIRRSAIGLNDARNVLFVAVSNDTTATAIAAAMRHAGATDVAQLDVNWSYPKFLVFSRGEAGLLHATSPFEGFAFRDDEYVRRPAARDFFYLVRRSE